MIVIKQIHNDKTEDFFFMENLMIESFPKEEYRELQTTKCFTKSHPYFKNFIICDDDNRIGEDDNIIGGDANGIGDDTNGIVDDTNGIGDDTNGIGDDTNGIGFITVWDFEDFLYIEHFAIRKDCRANGYGSRVLTEIKSMFKKPIVLEVEPICDEVTKKRVDFYKKMGFNCFKQEYKQPPYRKGDDSFSLVIMGYNIELSDDSFNRIKSILYQNVYQQ